MSPRFARLSFVALVIVAVSAMAVARRSSSEDIVEPPRVASAEALPIETESAPPLQPTGWLNTEPLTAADLEGNVVLYDFWTFGCSNCQHTLPYLKAWHERYAAEGLVVLGVHTPEFDYEAVPDNVAEYAAAEGITYPIALDADKETWRAFGTRGWPTFYLHDDQGRRRLRLVGEGRYDQMEDAIRALLGVDAGAPRATVVG